MQQHFIIRVYGLLINYRNEVLLSDEYVMDQFMTKFPGGGLEVGEGIKDCLIREFQEELEININEIQHFYTTDFYQPSAFHPGGQLISIYYKVQTPDFNKIETVTSPFAGLLKKNDTRVFRWKSIASLHQSDLSWPVDQHVIELLTSNRDL